MEKSWAHSGCREVEFDISSSDVHVVVSVARACVCVCVCECAHTYVHYSTPHKTLLPGLLYDIQHPVQGSTLDATIKLLCAAVRGIIQRKDPFVLKLKVADGYDEQVSRLVELEDIAKNKCAVTKKESQDDEWRHDLVTVLELRPHCECP